jgi:hypothetical protein
MTTPDNQPDKPLEQRARELYREAARRIDPNTAGRLRVARQRALDAARAPERHRARWLLPAGAFAVIALATMMVWQPSPHRGTNPSAHVAGMAEATADLDNDLPPDADKTDPNLYQNLDFYGWLAANNNKPATR